MRDEIDIYLAQGAEYIWASLRDRRVLKWLFSDQPIEIFDDIDSIDLETQRAMAEQFREMIRRTCLS